MDSGIDGTGTSKLHIDLYEVVQLVGEGDAVEKIAPDGLLEFQVVVAHLQEGQFSRLVISLQLVQVFLNASNHFLT